MLLDNLVENAVRYSPDGGSVEIGWGRKGHEAFVAVSDEGPGLKEDEEVRVFERFYRGSAAGGAAGTGLGLAIVDALARRWGGSARIENRGHRGARAEVLLPASAEEER